MGEILITRIKSVYGDIKGLLSQIPQEREIGLVRAFIVDQMNSTVDILTSLAGSDYSTYKVPHTEINRDWNEYPTSVVRTQLGRVISKLETEYGFNNIATTTPPGIVIFNKNENEISVNINYSIKELKDRYPDEPTKQKLSELEDELKKSVKNWDKIKPILIWVLNFSKELFLELLPLILQGKI
jgi:hypothetical protein